MKVGFLFDQQNRWIFEYIQRHMDSVKSINPILSFSLNSLSDCQLVFLLGYTKILKLDEFKMPVFVVHESDLPKGKGFAPIQNTILSGSNELTFSIIEAKSEVDSGRIFLQKKIKLNGSELYDELRKIQGRETLNLINSFLSKFPNLAPLDQKGRATYFPRRTPNDSELDVSKSILEQFNILRVVNNDEWPAFFYYQGKKFILKIYQE